MAAAAGGKSPRRSLTNELNDAGAAVPSDDDHLGECGEFSLLIAHSTTQCFRCYESDGSAPC
jgi:hypothetical protein